MAGGGVETLVDGQANLVDKVDLHVWQLFPLLPVHHGDGLQVELLLLQVALDQWIRFVADIRAYSK